jgi:hypothetical protein
MIEFGFSTTDGRKTAVAACFVTDLSAVVALGLIFAPFTLKTSEAVLPAYLIGMTLADAVGKAHALIRRPRRLHQIIDQPQHSALVAAIASAATPTIVARAFFLPRLLLPEAGPQGAPVGRGKAAAPGYIAARNE